MPVQVKFYTENIYMYNDPLHVQQFIMAAIIYEVKQRALTGSLVPYCKGPQLDPNAMHHESQLQQVSEHIQVSLVGPAPWAQPIC